MISKIANPIAKAPKAMVQGIGNFAKATAESTKGANKLDNFFRNETLGKILDSASDNEVMCQSAISLGICCVARPLTNFATTPDKKDAAYASAHSASSGITGFVWPLILATPLAAAVGVVLKKPQKFLNAETIKNFYPSVGTKEVMEKGKKITKVMTNAEGQMLRKDGTELWRNIDPLKLENGDAKGKLKEVMEKISKTNDSSAISSLNEQRRALEAKHSSFLENKAIFEAKNPDIYIDEVGIARSRIEMKIKGGKPQRDDKGDRGITGKGSNIGCIIQKPLKKEKINKVLSGEVQAEHRPVTKEMEIGIQKEQNMKTAINWTTDILLAPPRAILTIKLIPTILEQFGIEKNKKEIAPTNTENTQTTFAKPPMAYQPPKSFNGFKLMIASNNKKGGV